MEVVIEDINFKMMQIQIMIKNETQKLFEIIGQKKYKNEVFVIKI